VDRGEARILVADAVPETLQRWSED
jgi:hypothetical protein